MLAAPGALAAQPDPVTGLHARPAHQQVTLSWTLPAGNLTAVLVRRAEGNTPPAGINDGQQVYDELGTQVVDTGLQDGVNYSYSVWALQGPTPSDPKQVTVTPIPRSPLNVQLSADARQVTFGNPVTFRAKATTQNSKPAINEELQLQSRDSGASRWHVVDSANSDQQGRTTWSIRPQRNADYRVVHDATPYFDGAISAIKSIDVRPLLQARLGKDWAPQFGRAAVQGRVKPKFQGERVMLEGRTQGNWRTVDTAAQRSNGAYRFGLHGWNARGTYEYRVAVPENHRHRAAHSASLTLHVVRVVTYRVETRGHIVASLDGFKKQAAEIYADPRGWSRADVHFKRVKKGGDFSLVLAQAKEVPKFAPICDRYWSCRVGRYVIINQDRWRFGTPYFLKTGASMKEYREMVVDHETGHWFGLGHATCGGKGELAPVMMQQSKGLYGCKPNPWPLPGEIARVR